MSGNTDGAVSGGVQGAQMGAQVGGGWGALIGGVIGAAWGWFTPDKAQEQLEKYNQQVLENNARALFDNQRALNAERQNISAALRSYQDQEQVQQSSLRSSYGAAEMTGSSVNALSQALDFQTKEAMSVTKGNWETAILDYNSTVYQITNGSISSLQRSKNTKAQQLNVSGLVQQGIGMYKQYMGNRPTTTNSVSSQSGNYADFGSYGKSGSVTGYSSSIGLSA